MRAGHRCALYSPDCVAERTTQHHTNIIPEFCAPHSGTQCGSGDCDTKQPPDSFAWHVTSHNGAKCRPGVKFTDRIAKHAAVSVATNNDTNHGTEHQSDFPSQCHPDDTADSSGPYIRTKHNAFGV